MSMHLEGPWLSTTGKHKGKKKFASADAKRKSEQLDQSWKEILKRQGVEQEEKRKTRALASAPWAPTKTTYRGSEQPRIPSRDTGAGNAVLAPAKVYTGTKVKGIATMHKSNAVPVFSSEEAIAISNMRR